MPRSQFLKQTMENEKQKQKNEKIKKKNTESECSTKKINCQKEYKCNQNSPVCFV